MEKFDVIICGAGPAGLMTAFTLGSTTSGSLKILLLDRREPWREPVCCAEAVSNKTFSSLLPVDFSFVRCYTSWINYSSPKGYTAGTYKKNSSIILNRALFHRWLWDRCLEAGVDCRCNAAVKALERRDSWWDVTVEKEGAHQIISAPVVVDATGPGGRITRDIPWLKGIDPGDENMALAIFAVAEGVPCNKEALQFFFGSPFVDGYGWIFPRDDDAVNIGFGIPARAAQGHSLRQRLLAFIFRNNPHAKIRTICGGKVPLHSAHRSPFAMHGLFKAGDAAGCVDPIWGAGISEALECGRIVGKNIPDWLGKTDPEERRHVEGLVFDQWMGICGYFYQRSAIAKRIMNKITDDQWDIFLHHMSNLPQENQASVLNTLNNSPWLWPIMVWEVCEGLKNKNFC